MRYLGYYQITAKPEFGKRVSGPPLILVPVTLNHPFVWALDAGGRMPPKAGELSTLAKVYFLLYLKE
jgi:hypothetical protein